MIHPLLTAATRVLADIARDVRYAIRSLRASPGFVAAFVLTFALGVGVNTSVFGVVNGMIFRPLPVDEGDRIVVLARSVGPGRTLDGVSYPDLDDVRLGTTGAFDDVAGYQVGFAGLASDGTSPARVLVTWVTGNYFEMLRVKPAMGRVIEAGEGGPGRWDAVVVLGHATWQRRFGADPDVVGKTVRIDGRVSTIVGVAPPEFPGTFAFSESELFLPLHWSGIDLERRDAGSLHALARLGSGVSLSRAQAAVDRVVARLRREHPEHAALDMAAVPERYARPLEDQSRTNRLGAGVMLGIAGLVLLVAMVNITNLLLARVSGRSTALAIQSALGAGRGRLVRQLVTETLLLGLASGSVAVILSAWTVRALGALRPAGDLPFRFDFNVDGPVLLFAAGVTLLTSLIAGTVPAFRVLKGEWNRWLRGGRVASGAGRPSGGFVAAQTAACFVLLVTLGLFVRSIGQAERVDLGFRPDGVLNVHMDASHVGFDEGTGRAFFDEVERRVRGIPGVTDATFASTVPLGYVITSAHVEPYGRLAPPADRTIANRNAVGPSYFSTMGVPIVRGRAFDEGDDETAPRVAIVNRRLADILWPNEDPIGRQFSESGPSGPWLRVAGVTSTGRYRSLFEDPQPAFHVPLAQHYAALRVLHVRSVTSANEVAPAVERVIHELRPDLPLYDVQTMTRALETPRGFFLLRIAARFAGITAVLALILSVIGLAGLVSYTVAMRRHEFGVRLAHGAQPFDIAALVLRSGLAVTALGLAAGIAITVASSGALDRFLYQTSAREPLILLVAALVLVAASGIACLVPAQRAARTDPMRALRSE
jgi:predicted permease